jgi:hypothetical protein
VENKAITPHDPVQMTWREGDFIMVPRSLRTVPAQAGMVWVNSGGLGGYFASDGRILWGLSPQQAAVRAFLDGVRLKVRGYMVDYGIQEESPLQTVLDKIRAGANG